MSNPFRRFFCRKPVGFTVGQHVPVDPADDVEDFAHRYADPLDWQAGIHMEELLGHRAIIHGVVYQSRLIP